MTDEERTQYLKVNHIRIFQAQSTMNPEQRIQSISISLFGAYKQNNVSTEQAAKPDNSK